MPTVKHGGGGVIIWGCMATSGVSQLTFINSTLDPLGYLNTLKENLKHSAQNLNHGDDFSFQQDNDQKNTAHNVMFWLLYYIKKQFHTPPQSPDFNLIEYF